VHIILLGCLEFDISIQYCLGVYFFSRHSVDKVTGEHLMYGGCHIVVHLTLFFNSMLRHCFVPSAFCQGIVLPLLKHKHGDATDINMYRGVTISPVISKVFELILLQLYESFLISQPLQYGFKKGNSCNHALFIVTKSIRYFTNRGSRVYCSFLDATKAFYSFA